MQAGDQRGNGGLGVVQCTPSASEGGGTTGYVTDSNAFDPDAYRVMLETRPWPTGENQAVDVRLSWGCDSNCCEPDGFEVEMDVPETSVSDFCSPSHECEHAFGDCDTNADCASGTTCVEDVGPRYGYNEGSTDVCVD